MRDLAMEQLTAIHINKQTLGVCGVGDVRCSVQLYI